VRIKYLLVSIIDNPKLLNDSVIFHTFAKKKEEKKKKEQHLSHKKAEVFFIN